MNCENVYRDCINVCYCADKKYEKSLQIAINYLHRFYRDERELKIHVLTTDSSLSVPGAEIISIPHTYLSIAQLRVIAPIFINDKCIYLDSDTIVTTCISRLWDLSFAETTAMVVCLDMPTCKLAGDRYNIHSLKKLDRPFFNTGVIVFNCNLWRQYNMYDKCLEKFHEYRDTPSRYNDEPGINMAVDDCHILDSTWNYNPTPPHPYRKVNIIHPKGAKLSNKPTHTLFNHNIKKT